MLQRIGVSLDDDLLMKFDELILNHGYSNRSEAIRDLIRDRLVQKDWEQSNKKGMGVVVLVYNHHYSDISHQLSHIQHENFASVISTLHVHVDHDNCLELLVLKGKNKDIQEMGQKLVSAKGVKYGKFIAATTGRGLT